MSPGPSSGMNGWVYPMPRESWKEVLWRAAELAVEDDVGYADFTDKADDLWFDADYQALENRKRDEARKILERNEG